MRVSGAVRRIARSEPGGWKRVYRPERSKRADQIQARAAAQREGKEPWHSRITAAVLTDPRFHELRLAAKMTLVGICLFTGPEHRCEVSQRAIAAAAGIHTRTVRSATHALRAAGLLEVEPNFRRATYAERAAQKPNTYRVFLTHPEPGEAVGPSHGERPEGEASSEGGAPVERPRARRARDLLRARREAEETIAAAEAARASASAERAELEHARRVADERTRQAEALAARATLDGLAPVLQLRADELGELGAELDALPPIQAPRGVFQAVDPVLEEINRARRERVAVGRSLQFSRHELAALLEQAAATEPPVGGGWPRLAHAAQEAIQRAAVATATARQLLDATRRGGQLRDRQGKAYADAREAAATSWAPPPGVRLSAEGWAAKASTWRAAHAAGLRAVCAGIEAQGYDPAWPEPPGTGPPNGGQRGA